ncbi:MAG: SAM-dependent methyltransferase [Beutenbergiaceae bacterium]
MTTDSHDHPDPTTDPATHWESRYAQSDRMWSGRVNPTTADVISTLRPGRALDLGCGEGGDAVWMAEQGWRVSAVDLSETAVARGEQVATARGLGSLITWVVADAQTWQPDGTFDLVVASFFHSEVALERTQTLVRLASRIEPGGHLLLVSHAGPPPWATGAHHADLPTPEQELERLALPEHQWRRVIAETRTRPATGPDGEPAHLDDAVVLLRRQ